MAPLVCHVVKRKVGKRLSAFIEQTLTDSRFCHVTRAELEEFVWRRSRRSCLNELYPKIVWSAAGLRAERWGYACDECHKRAGLWRRSEWEKGEPKRLCEDCFKWGSEERSWKYGIPSVITMLKHEIHRSVDG